MPSSRTLLSGLVLLSSLSPVLASWSDNFAGFFPTYNQGFQTLLKNECAGNYTEYLKGREDVSKADPKLKAFGINSLTTNVIQCLLEAAPELVKSRMASAQVGLFFNYVRSSSLMNFRYFSGMYIRFPFQGLAEC